MDRLLDFIIIGAHKAGSTTLYYYLRQHPQVFLPDVIENRFFTNEEFYCQGPTYLAPYYKGLDQERVAGGKNVHILYLPDSLKRVAEYNRHIKLIAVLRNPIERAYSAYWFARRHGWESRETFEAALDKENERLSGSYDERTELTYLAHGHYAQQLQTAFEMFGEKHVRVCLTDDLQADPSTIVGETLKWLDIKRPHEHGFDFSRIHNQAAMPSVPFFHRIVMARDIWYRRLARRAIPYSARLYMQTHIIDPLLRLNEKSFRYPPMRQNTRTELRDYFEPHNRRLEELLGRDLSHWR